MRQLRGAGLGRPIACAAQGMRSLSDEAHKIDATERHLKRAGKLTEKIFVPIADLEPELPLAEHMLDK